MGRISRAAAGAAVGLALVGGLAGAAFAAVPAGIAAGAHGAGGPVQVCYPTAVEYGTAVGCATSAVTAIEY
jgi:hypothetical protein